MCFENSISRKENFSSLLRGTHVFREFNFNKGKLSIFVEGGTHVFREFNFKKGKLSIFVEGGTHVFHEKSSRCVVQYKLLIRKSDFGCNPPPIPQ